MSTTLNTNPGAYNNEPGSDLFHTMVFGNVDNADIPNNVEDPFISYNEDAKEYEQFVVESDKRYSALMRKLNQLNRNQYMTRTLAMECASVMPKFLEKRRIESFTMTPSRTNYHYACESVHWAVWGLVAAGMAALVALGWKLYRVITGTGSSSDSGSSGGGGGGSGPMTADEAAKAAQTTSTRTERTIERRELRTKAMADVKKELNDLISHQDGVVKITEANTSKEIYDALDKKYTKEDGVQLDMTAVNALLNAMYPTEGTHEYALLNGVAANDAMWVIFHKPDQAYVAKSNIADLMDHFNEVYKKIDEILAVYIDINGADVDKLRDARQRAEMLMHELDKTLRRDADGAENKSAIMLRFWALKHAIKAPINAPRLGAQDLNKILDVVSNNEGEYVTLFKQFAELMFVGDKSLTYVIGQWLVKIDDVKKKVDARVKAAETTPREKVTAEGAAEVNRDSEAKDMQGILKKIRDAMQLAKETMGTVKHYNDEVLKLDDVIGKMIINLLKTLQKIYKDNGKQTNKFTELANSIAKGLGGGVNVFS